MLKINLPFLIIGLFIGQLAIAQQLKIKGLVQDESAMKPLSDVSVRLNGKEVAKSDSLGFFSINSKPGKQLLIFSKVGYKNEEISFEEQLEGTREFTIFLVPFVNQLNQVVIAASKNAKEIAREVSSVNVIQPYLISNTNATDLAEVLNKIPGINVVDGQPTIRGGVGFSYNTGSRVAILLDDMPLLGADLGDVRWNFLPIESAAQVEVIKGSASVLYGSSALNGTVNVRTGWAVNKPETKITFYSGINSNPQRKETIWWGPSERPFSNGMFFSHKQKFGKFDLVWSGQAQSVRSHLQGADNQRARTYIKTRYNVSKNFSYGVNFNGMYERSGRFFLWKDADSGALKPLNDYVVDDLYRIISIDPHAEWKRGKSTHQFKARLYQIHRFVDRTLPNKANENDAIANLYAFDYNFQRKLGKYFYVTAGSYITALWAVGNVYKGTFAGFSRAAFSQLEYRHKRWSAVVGGRYEINGLSNYEEPTGLLKRFGLNYQAGEKTFFRANYSEGYRFPTIGEKFVEDKAAGVKIFPNQDLVSEKGWTAEVGMQQGFKIGNFNGAIDFAFFNQEYDSMIEFQFGQWIPSSTGLPIEERIGFKANNIGQTRIAGFEVSLTGEGRIGNVLIRTLGGYTYSMPVNLSTNPEMKDWNTYLDALVNSVERLDSANYYAPLLAYRNRSTAKWDIEASYRMLSFGYTLNYYSIYEKVDEFILVFLPGANEFFDRAGKGDLVQNLRIACNVNPNTRVSFIVNNFTNTEYATRPTKVDPPRSFNLQLRVMF
jgi:iron complex outermembrane receptor protein